MQVKNIEYDVKLASSEELLNKLADCQAMIDSKYIAENAKQLAGQLKHRVKKEILLRMSNEPKEELKCPEKVLPLREVTDEEMEQAVEKGRALQRELHEEFKALQPDAETMNMRFQ